MRPVNSRYPVTLGYREKANFNPNYIHRGIDYGCPAGTSVVAATGGVVVYAADARRASAGSYGPAYGIQVIVKVNSIYCIYAHLSRVSVKKGQSVLPGQEVGKSGATGNVRGAHLHYQECTKPPAAYTSDRRPEFISAPATKPTISPVAQRDAWIVDTETLNGRDFPHPDWGKVITTRHRGEGMITQKEVKVDGRYWNYREADSAWYCQDYLKRTYFPENAQRKDYIVIVDTANVRNGPYGDVINTLSKDDTFTSVGYELKDGTKWLVNSKYEWTASTNVRELIKTAVPEEPIPKGYYPQADYKTQNYTTKYLGVEMNTNCVIIHSTEVNAWPSYQDGATAPHMTIAPDFEHETVVIRQHFAANRSARALSHPSGTVETNTLNVFQIELVGTCDPQIHNKWTSKHIYMPEAPQWFIDGVADVLVWLKKEFPAVQIKDGAPRGWPAYPESISTNKYRMTDNEWLDFNGIAGHSHVPHNTHGDPGNFPINKLTTSVNAANLNSPSSLPDSAVTSSLESPMTENFLDKIVNWFVKIKW